MLFEGQSTLTVGDKQVELRGRFPVASFSGAIETRCVLHNTNAALAFNVMHSGRCLALRPYILDASGISFHEFSDPPNWADCELPIINVVDILVCVQGACTLNGQESRRVGECELDRHDALLISRSPDEMAAQLTFKGNALLAVAKLAISSAS
jgi:hypothetical protein